MSKIQARGVDFNVRRIGDGPPVVMLHGLLTGSIATWYFTVAPHLAESCSPVMIDMRGHGRSSRPVSGYGATSMAEDLEVLTRHLPAFPIVAHSYGCLVAARFALANPYRVLGLTFVEPPFALSLDPDLDLTEMREPVDRRTAHLRALLDETSLLADIDAEPELTEEEIAALPGELLVVFGDQSPCRTGEVLVRRNRPDAWVVVLPGGHDVHIRSTAALTDVVQRQLARSLGADALARPDRDGAGPQIEAGPLDAGRLGDFGDLARSSL